MNFFRLVKHDFMNIIRNPMLTLINTIFPLVLFAGFGLVTYSQFGKGNISSFDYYGLTTMIFTAIMISMTVTNTFMEEKVKKGNLRVTYTPTSKTEIYLSKLVSTYIFGTIVYSVIILIEQYIFHCNLGGKNIPYILLLINLLILFGCSIGTMICSIFKSEESSNTVMPIITMVFVFFSGVFSPIGHFGKNIQSKAYLSPVTWVTDSALKIIYDNNFSLYLPAIAILLASSIICIILCQIIFKPEEYL